MPDDLLQRWADAWRGEPRALARAGATLLAYASGYVAGGTGFAWLLRHVAVVAWPDPAGWGREALRLLDIGMTFGAALAAFDMLAKTEGILPALESSHAVAKAMELAAERPQSEAIVVCLSGRGDKDAAEIARLREG